MTYPVSSLIRKDIITPLYVQRKDPSYYKKEGDRLMDKNKYDYAIYNYKKSLELFPERREVLLNLSNAMWKSKVSE